MMGDRTTALPTASQTRSMAQWEQVFAGAGAPDGGALQGVYRGRIVALAGLDSLPGGLGRLVTGGTSRLRFPWFGKAFDGNRGANVWLTSTGRFQRFSYDVHYGQREVRLPYDRPDNPRVVRPLVGEVRLLEPGRYLCRAVYQGRTLMYFTLGA